MDVVTTDTNTMFPAPQPNTDVVTYDPDCDIWYVTVGHDLYFVADEAEGLALWSEQNNRLKKEGKQ